MLRINIKDGFVSNVLKLTTGNVVARAISIGAIPFITRLFSPDQFGIFSIFCSVVAIFSIFSSLSYVLAVLLPPDDRDASNIAILSISVVILMAFMVFLTIIFFGDWLGGLLEVDMTWPFLLLAGTSRRVFWKTARLQESPPCQA